MKKLFTALVSISLVTLGAFAEVTNNVVNIDEIAVSVTPTAGATILADSVDIDAVLVVSPATAVTITNTSPGQVWVPIGLAIDVGLATTTSTVVPSYSAAGSTVAFQLASIAMYTGTETYTAFPAYPALAYGDKLTLTANTTNNSYVVTFVKKVIPR